jgi:hypothetical protein
VNGFESSKLSRIRDVHYFRLGNICACGLTPMKLSDLGLSAFSERITFLKIAISVLTDDIRTSTITTSNQTSWVRFLSIWGIGRQWLLKKTIYLPCRLCTCHSDLPTPPTRFRSQHIQSHALTLSTAPANTGAKKQKKKWSKGKGT